MKILNSQGKEIVLNQREQRIADVNQRLCNALGFEISITTLTQILKKVSEQKFFKIPFADYVPVRVGEGAWGTQITKYRSFELADDFETGIIDVGGNNGRIAEVSTGVDPINQKIINWAKGYGWTLFQLEQASRSGNWDLIASLEKSRKTNWDLGIQRTAFLGSKGDTGTAVGLLNLAGVTNNTTTITKAISSMSTTEFKAFVIALIEAYRANCARTTMPTHFVIPESDYNGLTAPTSADFPLKSMLQVMLEAFREITQNPNFVIKPCAYADAANSGGVLSQQRYALYNYDEDSLAMNIPVDYTSTLANSINNFSFQNVGFGQFTGVGLYRPLEVLYFSY